MIIEKINIKSFGMIKDSSFEFSDTINVIEGSNEAGKSTIAAFIKYMLYGFDAEDEKNGELLERPKRLNWETGIAEGSMTVKVKDKKYLITRRCERTESVGRPSYKEENSIIDLDTGAPAFGKMAAGEVFFGVDKELFENTAFVGQIGDSSINRGSVKESIENILFSGNEKINNQRAASRVADKMETYLHKTGGGGAIYDLERRSSEFYEKFKRSDEDNKEILAKEAKLHEIKSEREQEIKNEAKLTELDRCYENMQIIRAFDELHDNEKKADEKAEEYAAYVSRNTRAGFAPTGKYLTDLTVFRRGVDDSYRALIDAESEYERAKNAVGITREIENAISYSDTLGGEAEVKKKIDNVTKDNVKNIVFSSLAALVFLASLVIEVVAKGVLAHVAFRIIFGVFAAAAVGSGFYLLLRFLQNKKALSELQDKFSTSDLENLKKKLTVIAEARAKRDSVLNAIENARIAVERGKEDWARAKENLAAAVTLWGGEIPTEKPNEYLDKLEEKLRAYLDEEARLRSEKCELEIIVREARKQLAGKSEVNIRAQVSPLKRKVLSEIDHEGILEGIKLCRERIAELLVEAELVENELSTLKMRATDPAALYSKMQANDAKIAELRQEYEAHKLAFDSIMKASENLREEISPRLGEFSTELMSLMTDKKYTSLDVNDGLKVSFIANDGEKKSVDFLSGGTRDLTYIAVRMALIDMLYTEKPPVAFDESFAHQDNIRARSMMKAVAALASEGHQSFIFTCRQREAAIAREFEKKTEVFRLSSSCDALS